MVFASFSTTFRTWKQFASNSPALRLSRNVIFWLPTGIVFVKYGYTVRVVTGNSMQVCQWLGLVRALLVLSICAR